MREWVGGAEAEAEGEVKDEDVGPSKQASPRPRRRNATTKTRWMKVSTIYRRFVPLCSRFLSLQPTPKPLKFAIGDTSYKKPSAKQYTQTRFGICFFQPFYVPDFGPLPFLLVFHFSSAILPHPCRFQTFCISQLLHSTTPHSTPVFGSTFAFPLSSPFPFPT